MKLLKDLKDLYPTYFWGIFGSTALKMFDQSQSFCNNTEEKLKDLTPSDIDVVTNASICSGAFKKLVGMLEDVVLIEQEHKGKYEIDVIRKRIKVHCASGDVYDFVFVRDLTNIEEWSDYQYSSVTECFIEVPPDPKSGRDTTVITKDFLRWYRASSEDENKSLLTYKRRPWLKPTDEHVAKVKRLNKIKI